MRGELEGCPPLRISGTCLATQKQHKMRTYIQAPRAHTYIHKSCHPNLNPIYHQTNGMFPWSRRWLACSLYASSEISGFSRALFPLCLLLSRSSHTPPSSSSSHHRAALNVLLFVYLFICCFSSAGEKQWSLRYLGLTWRGMAAAPVIEERDRYFLIRSPQMPRREGGKLHRGGEEGRRGKEERREVGRRGEKSFQAFDTCRLLSAQHLRV